MDVIVETPKIVFFTSFLNKGLERTLDQMNMPQVFEKPININTVRSILAANI